MKKSLFIVALLSFLFTCSGLNAHEGRRFEVEILENQLVALGSIGGGVDDGGGIVRPYYNSMHDHWINSETDIKATSSLPAWDILEPGDLVGHSVSLELVDTFKWVDPPLMPSSGTVPDFISLEPAELITISAASGKINSDVNGVLELIDMVDVHGHFDLQFDYEINKRPTGEIFIMEWVISTSAPGVLDSESVFTILSPAGSTPEERLHHASLYTEQYLGIPVSVPEPATGTFISILVGLAAFGRHRRRSA